MILSLWRRLRDRNPGRAGGRFRQGGRPYSCRPQLEPLEDRVLPALGPSAGLAMVAMPAAVSGLPWSGVKPTGGVPIFVTVAENASPTAVDLGPAFSAMSGLRPGSGLKLSILGNTNSGLVQTNLSKTLLTLTYSPAAMGTATITVRATDADGVSAQQTLQVTVCPSWSLGSVGVAPMPLGMPPGRVGAAP